MSTYRFCVSVMPKDGILDPQGRAVETSLPHLGVGNVHAVRVGRRVELSVDAVSEAAARATVEHLAAELFANPLIESWTVDPISDRVGEGTGGGRVGPLGSGAAGPGGEGEGPIAR